VIAFRCGRCGDWTRAEDGEAGKAVACKRCQHVNICPEQSSAPPTLAPRERSQPPVENGSTWMWAAVAVFVLAAGGWGLWAAIGASDADPVSASTLTPADALQQELLRKNADQPGDPRLNQMYADLNSKHFSGALPALQVLWEPRLADVGKLAAQQFTLEGMFGHVGRTSVILLNPDLQSDSKALARALSHEMVHAHLFSIGDTKSDHGPAFQAVLKRLSDEGAFEGIVSTDEDRQRLRAWIDEESTRLDSERLEFDRHGAEVERQRVDVERALADLNARMTAANAAGHGWPSESEIAAVSAQRDEYNRKAGDANERAIRDRADIDYFNRQVARYNLMLVYPDGMDVNSVVKTKSVK
jgi:hypothetical protein